MREIESLDHVADHHTFLGDVEHGEIRIDALDAAGGGQRIAAALADARAAILGRMLDEDAHLPRSRREIHRATDTWREARILGRPVREIARLGDLERAEQRQIEMTAADHQEGIVVMKEHAAGHEGGQALAGIDEILVLLTRLGRGSHAEDAVLAVEHDLAVPRNEIRDHRRQADPEIDVSAVGDVLRGTPCHLAAGQGLHRGLLSHTTTMRSTKMPGVCTHSGSSTPSSTISRTCTMVRSAAIAITGLKLRADLR